MGLLNEQQIALAIEAMKEYVSAIKAFERDLIKDGFERIPYGEISDLELEGVWYRGRIKK